MKIAVVHWIVNDVGGINSWTENFVTGLQQLGHSVQVYYGSYQRKLGCDPDKKVARSRRYHLLPARLLSYHAQELAKSVRTLNSYDLIVFAHPSPHPTKGNLGVENPKNWQKLYTYTSPFKISVFHDRHWDRTNPWIEEVQQTIGYVHAAQHHFLDSVSKFCKSNVPFNWGMFPLNVPDKICSKPKSRRFVLATQWLALKNHRFLIPNLDKLEIPLHSYGSGQTYHNLLPKMKRVYREDYHQDEVQVYNPNSFHIHWGHTEYAEVLKQMSKAMFSLDLSIQGMTNMTHWEPLTLGTISVLEHRVVSDPYCEIPEDCCVSFNLDNVVDDLNRIGKTSRKDLKSIQEVAWKFVQKCKSKTVAHDLLRKAGIK